MILESGLEPFVPALMERLLPLLMSKNTSRSIPENAAITIGRIALVVPTLLAPNFETFIQPL